MKENPKEIETNGIDINDETSSSSNVISSGESQEKSYVIGESSHKHKSNCTINSKDDNFTPKIPT